MALSIKKMSVKVPTAPITLLLMMATALLYREMAMLCDLMMPSVAINVEKDAGKLSGPDFTNAPIPIPHGKDVSVAITQAGKNTMKMLVHQNHNGTEATKMPPQKVCDVLLDSFNGGEGVNSVSAARKQVSYSLLSCDDHRLGNKLPLIYMNQVLARSAGASFSWECLSKDTESIIHLLQELHFAKKHSQIMNNAATTTPSLQSICNSCRDDVPFRCLAPSIGLAAESIRQDLKVVTSTIEPTLPTPVTDVAIHLRCGDLFNTRIGAYGFLPHSTYVRLIQDEYGLDALSSRELNASIGIITQPYGSSNSTRKNEIQHGSRCQIIVNDLMKTLETTFPASRVELFNQPEHMAIPRTWTRIAKAKRMAICGTSTFALWPTLASRKAYVYGWIPWMKELSQQWDSLEVFKSPLLNRYTGKTAKDNSLPPPLSDWDMEDILRWLRDN